MDAPERIWVWENHDGLSASRGWNLQTSFDAKEYIRADLPAPDMAELVEALRECHDALRDHAKMYPHMVKGFTHDAEKRAAAALALIAHNTTEG